MIFRFKNADWKFIEVKFRGEFLLIPYRHKWNVGGRATNLDWLCFRFTYYGDRTKK